MHPKSKARFSRALLKVACELQPSGSHQMCNGYRRFCSAAVHSHCLHLLLKFKDQFYIAWTPQQSLSFSLSLSSCLFVPPSCSLAYTAAPLGCSLWCFHLCSVHHTLIQYIDNMYRVHLHNVHKSNRICRLKYFTCNNTKKITKQKDNIVKS